MAGRTKLDVTASLPDEVLLQIFHLLPSLCDKLRVERVSRRFQRCLVQLLNTQPIPLEIKIAWKQLNGYKVRQKLSKVVHALAKKAKFSSIELCSPSSSCQFESILKILVSSHNDCLDKVTVFEISYCSVTNWRLLEKVLDKCTKLSGVRITFDFDCSTDVENVGLALKGKALTEFSISGPPSHTQLPLIQLYQSLKSNTLKMTSLSLSGVTLDVDVLMTELYGGAWAALEEIEFAWRGAHLDMVKLICSLSQLPALRTCNIYLSVRGVQYQMAAALTSLFGNQTEITVSFDRIHSFGCEIVALIRQVQAVHQDLQVDFVGPGARELILTLGKVRFQTELFHTWWHDPDCTVCGMLYPTLTSLLWSRANATQSDMHLANARLDRCRVETIVGHLNQHSEEGCKALHAEMNEAQDLATITFEGRQGMFQITLGCGRCLANGCFRCVHVG